MIERRQVISKLEHALGSGSVLLTAGAGYGKTVALEQTLRRNGHRCAWVSCEAADRDPGRLLVDVIDAIRRAVPGAVDVLGDRLAAGIQPVDPVSTLRQLVDELDSLLVEPLVVVIDDGEHLEDAPEAVRLANEMLAARSDKLRVALASRRPLPLRVAKLRTAGKLAELGPAELTFTAEECAEFLRERHGREPSEEEVARAMEATEGWPLGIALSDATAASAAAPDPASRGALFAFLGEEVLERLDGPFRAALLASSLPRELNAEVGEALDLGEDFVETVQRMGLSLHPVDRDRRWFRHHPLVREFLSERLEEERTPEELLELHARVAPPLAQAGRLNEAVEHWLAGQCWEEAIAGIGFAGPGLVGAAPGTVRGWLDRLPEAARERPSMLLLQGRLEYGAGRHHDAADLIRRAMLEYRSRGDLGKEWATRLALIDTLHASGDFDEAIALAEDVSAPETAELPAAPNLAVMAAMCLSHQGRFEEAEELNRKALEHPAGEAAAGLARALDGLFLDRPAGRLDDAVRKSREALDLLERFDPFERSPFVRALLHLVLEEQGLDDEALAESVRAQEHARRIGVEGYLMAMLQMHSVGIHARAGRLDEAQRELDRAGAAEQGAGWRQVGVGRATLAAARGEAKEALALAEEAIAKTVDGPFLQRIHAVAFLAPVIAGAGQPGRARELVEEVLADWRPGFYRGRLLALRAWLRHAEGDSGWREDLMTAFVETGDQLSHLLRREWPRLEPLVWDALETGVVTPDSILPAVRGAFPGEFELWSFLDHPVAEVRRAAVAPAAASGHPRALARVEELAADPDAGVATAARVAIERMTQEPPPLIFRLLGHFEARRGVWTVTDADWKRPMVARLVRFLLVNRDRAVAERELFEAFWPGKAEASARHSLHQAVSQARAVLELPGSDVKAIETGNRRYRLRLGEGDLVDLDEFEAAATAALGESGASRLRLLERAARLWAGEPLPEDHYEPWADAAREALTERYAQLLMALMDEHRRAGNLTELGLVARRLVEVDPLNERAHRELMLAYAATGRRAHALRQYLECRRLLVQNIGVEPGSETSRLHGEILAGAVG